jgi:acylphosphatase
MSREQRREVTDVVRRTVIVSGRVQGVFFRDTARREADSKGVAGSARNLPDGTVEVVLEGAPGAVAEMVKWCRQGPPQAHVSGIEVTDSDPEGLRGFEIGGE